MTCAVVAAILFLIHAININRPMLLTHASGFWSVAPLACEFFVTTGDRETDRERGGWGGEEGREKKKRFGHDVMLSDSLVFGIESTVALLY